jgi:hypothetical protein
MQRRRCPVCKKMREFRKGQKNCSFSCARVAVSKARSHEHKRRIALKAGTASAAAQRRRREARVNELTANLSPVEAFKRGYAMGYSAGFARGCYNIPTDRMLNGRQVSRKDAEMS